ncbi:hypothetical protein FNF31_00672 [Cafeteria roenbergensis]|uniref:Adenylosuccinate synthetase n=1 Tax=Cafeteria roenbergensis TaxID=33653 RepID=A0A5A8DSX8_CAFRO|nr:hypothetical protein FNF31_00672 [Cafeteria roenbergensis]
MLANASVARAARAAASGARTMATSVSGLNSRVCAVLGGQWGDEGKGKLADVLAKNYDIVARFNGGANAGHTVVNLLGNGVAVDLDALDEETAPLESEGIEWRNRLFISDRAHLVTSFHKIVDGLQETRRAKGAIGTTKKGMGPCYTAKAARSMALRVGMLRHWDSFATHFRNVVEDHQRLYDFEYETEAELERIREQASRVNPMVVDGVHMINKAYADGRSIITEGANALMLDLDFGTYPYVTSSSTGAGGICTGLGLSPNKVESSIGVMKAYTTRVGSGPFPTELTDSRGGGDLPDFAPGTDIGLHLQTVGAEIGVTTGRKRRCGWLDAVVMRYSHMVNGYASINITKLDVLDELEEVRIGVAYSLDGQVLPPGMMPSTLEDLGRVEVQYETMPGWQTSIADCRSWDDLPANAQAYIRRVEELVGCPVSWVGVGPGREAMLQLCD